MDEDEAALLAELRAISNSSAAAGRFQNDEEPTHSDAVTPAKEEVTNDASFVSAKSSASPTNDHFQDAVTGSAVKSTKSPENTPPSKTDGIMATNSDMDVVVVSVAPPSPSVVANEASKVSQTETETQTFGIISSMPSTFQGDRGGAAEDEELLAELRAISQKSASANRFADDDTSNQASTEEKVAAPIENVAMADSDVTENKARPSSKGKTDELPPWKRGKKQAKKEPAAAFDVDIVVSEPPEAPVEHESELQPMGIKSSLPSTFQGDRGGAAEDAELLAELRAISQKSSSTDRFAEETNNEVMHEPIVPESVENTVAGGAKEQAKSSQESLPPWKRGKKAAKSQHAEVEIVVAAPPTPSPEPTPAATTEPEPQSFGIKSTMPSTFTGDRGGTAEDAELLAELRAISQKSASADRFADEETTDKSDGVSAMETTENAVVASSTKSVSESASSTNKPSAKPSTSKPKSPVLPPWKRGKKKAETTEVEVVVAAPPAPTEQSEPSSQAKTTSDAPPAFGIDSSLPSTFQGERGGSAEDAELLAELRAISQKSSSADRFADDNGTSTGGESSAAVRIVEDTHNEVSSTDGPPPELSNARAKSPLLPPWKRGKKKTAESQSSNVDIVVAGPPPPILQSEPVDVGPQRMGIKSSLPSTFQGDRGGSAEDAELLAELRAISQKSSSADRFSDAEVPTEKALISSSSIPAEDVVAHPSNQNADGSISRCKESSESTSTRAKSPLLPPWKRGKTNNTSTEVLDVVVAAAPPPREEPEPIDTGPQSMGIKSSLPSTFHGDRGGSAEDVELLAELRAISQKSSSADRFGNFDDNKKSGGGTNTLETVEDAVASQPQKEVPNTKSKSPLLPPWKRGKKKVAEPTQEEVVVAEPINMADSRAESDDYQPSQPQGGIKSDLPSTFKGERGGAAEDADLLAELRAISSGTSAGASRFSDEPSEGTESSGTVGESNALGSQRRDGGSSSVATLIGSTSNSTTSGPPLLPAATLDSESPVTRESLPSFVTDKNWKLRKEAYVLLRSLLADRVKKGEGNGNISGDTLMPALDEAIPAMVADKNAGALDSALAFAVEYAEHCEEASSLELASKITTSMVKGGALSSSKPTTSKAASALALKLMEVGDDGSASVHAVSEVLLSDGLSSRKPKVVIASSGLILQAAYDFGAASLPLAAISSSAPKMLSHSNATVRETGMKIVAEICRALGSKAPLQGLVDCMKKAQLSQLDSVLESQSEPTPIRVGLRSTKGSNATKAPGDALAALEAGAKELEARRYAEREPVNIFLALPKTDYSTRMKLPKWSEKVAALDIALECGGETPYKLVQPSSSANYSPLISEMKTLLSHSHFAVASKSMKVLSMLAEGVGSGLFPHLRPLLRQMIMLSKDKKLNRSVGESLDAFFGNVLDIDHLLDKDDALPSVLNEKAQKNALVRASALDYLGRCIKRGVSAGPRGRVTSKSAAAAARLCCEKLEDSDASVRKAATECLRSLLSVEDEAVSNAISTIIESLSSKNSRAYKSLMGSNGSERKRSVPKAPAASKRRTETVPAKSSPPRAEARLSRSKKFSPTKSNAPTRTKPAPSSIVTSEPQVDDSTNAPNLEEAITLVSSIQVPSWDAPDDDGGILAGLKSSKWLLRQNAILNLAEFSKTRESPVGTNDETTAALVVLVKEHTKGFRETNVNVTKAIMELFVSLCEAHAEEGRPFPGWACKDGIKLSVDKIADKKLSSISSKLLTEMCCVRPPAGVIEYGTVCIDKVKSPLGHEAFSKWFQSFLVDFGAPSMASALQNIAPWLVKECEASNPKVKRVAQSVVGELHVQLGPAARALVLSSCDDSSSVKSQLERVIDENTFDPTASKIERERTCVVLQSKNGAGAVDNAKASSVLLDLPKMDLPASLPNDCIENMGAKEGKNAWKLRKQALDDVDAAVKKSNGLISTDSMRPLVELLRALRERLSDSQSNLKPVAARIIGSILGSVDTASQAKLGKIVFAPLVSAVMNDNRKPMREASLEAIRLGTTASSVEGGEPNRSSLESLVVALVGELSESEYKAGGIPDMLVFIVGVAEYLPNLDSIAARGQTLGDKFAAVMVACLTSSKSETRSAAEELLKCCIENEKLNLTSVKKGMKHLLPAQQRTVIPIVARLPHPSHPGSPSNGGKENSVPSPTRRSHRQRKPSGASVVARTASSPRQRRRPDTSRRIEDRGRAGPTTKASDPFGMEAAEPDNDHLHPLIAIGEPGKKRLSSSRRINWPLHPEEPNSPMQISALKKLWSRSLPTRSLTALFPAGGIKKQEDAMAGCALLCEAIEKDRVGKEEAIVDHIDLIFMWTSFALCSRESTVGLQSLITLLVRLFTFLEDHKYRLSDGDACILLPHVFEKASIAKGRFREQFNKVIECFRSEDILSTRSLGQVICVPLIEHSHQSKTRVLALHECGTCVERVGLSGLGKKGLLVTAKTLSSESLPENRTAALDLMETVLSKMDGDVDKLASICGTENLSDKGRAAIAERWKKHSGFHQPSMPRESTQRNDRGRRQSQIPSSRIGMGPGGSSRRVAPPSPDGYSRRREQDGTDVERVTMEGLRDELPSFKLSLDDRKVMGVASRHTESGAPVSGPFTFSLDTKEPPSHIEEDTVDIKEEFRWRDKNSTVVPEVEDMAQAGVSSAAVASSSTSETATEGAAASLRARLRKIREKQREESAAPPVPPSSSVQPETSPDLSSPLVEPTSEPTKDVDEVHELKKREAKVPENSYDGLRSCIEDLLHTKPPVPEAHPYLRDCTTALKKYHSAISNQPGAAPDMSSSEFSQLRQSITSQTVETIENLTSVVVFAFDCDFPENTAGMSIPLLSVALATLMALFRDTGLSQNVTQDALALLIREAGKALLDPRLAMSSQHASQLDESTSSQMVRAINKLAVQAATGSPRDVSIEALLALQLQLCTVGNETAADAAFNSRLSRIVSKLFAKVLKAEAASITPFSPETVDVEAIICALEDMLVATTMAPGAPNRNRQDAVETCSSMGRALLVPILNARGLGGVEEFRAMMDELGIHSRDSKLAKLVTSCEAELNFSSSSAEPDVTAENPETKALPSSVPSSPSQPPSMTVASLVSELGSAAEGPEREAAVAALRRYNELNGKDELHDHLRDVSETFRTFILEQLDESPPSSEKPSLGESNAQSRSMPMSERIRFLRSKLNATEASVQSAVQPTEPSKLSVDTKGQDKAPSSQPSSPSRGIPAPRTPSRRNVADARLTPSRIPKPSPSSKSTSTSTAQSLRERLAAAQKNRASKASESNESSGGTSAYGHAAALRARLEAVKQQSKRDQLK